MALDIKDIRRYFAEVIFCEKNIIYNINNNSISIIRLYEKGRYKSKVDYLRLT